VLVEALHAGLERQYIDTEVKFEDGRSGRISADLKIYSVPLVALNLVKAA